MRKLATILVVLAACYASAQVKINSGVRINPGVRISEAVMSQQLPALAQPIVGSSATTAVYATPAKVDNAGCDASTCAFPLAQTAHNLNWVAVSFTGTGDITGVTDQAGNTYTPVSATFDGGTAGKIRIFIAPDIAAYGTGNTVTAQLSGSITSRVYHLASFSGLAKTMGEVLDVVATGSGTATGTTVVTTSSVTTTAPGVLVIGTMTDGSFVGSSSDATTGFTTLTLNGWGTTASYKISGAAGAAQGKAQTNGSAHWALQMTALRAQATSATVKPAFAQAQGVHHLNAVIIGWKDGTRSITSVADDAGNTYSVAAAASTYTFMGSTLRQAVYYAKDIVAYAAGNKVTVTWNGVPGAPSVSILEFSGLDLTSPLDTSGAKGGTYSCSTCLPTTVATDPVVTATSTELLVAGGITTGGFATAGSGYTGESNSGTLAEYRAVTSTGGYVGDATVTAANQSWLMSLAAFKAAAQIIVTPVSATVTSVSPTQALTTAATPLTITGTGFVATSSVQIGAAACTNVVVVSPTSITCSAPPAPRGKVDVTVTNPGADPATLSNGLRYGVYLTAAMSPAAGGTITGVNGALSCPGNCQVLVDNNANVSVSAAANTGYTFSGWTQCDTPSGANCSEQMGTADYVTTANFTASNVYRMTAAKNPVGGGAVASTSPDTQINCGSFCYGDYASGTSLVLKATANTGYTFSGWTGCDVPVGDQCTLNVGPAPWTVTANFSTAAVGTKYVSTTGSDSNPGTSALPWRTIQHAADTAVAGDTVIIRAGTYQEYVNVTRGGTSGNPITFQGEKSGSTFLTILDPTREVPHSWAVYDSTNGVYRMPWSSMPGGAEPYIMTIDDAGVRKWVFRWMDSKMTEGMQKMQSSPTVTQGLPYDSATIGVFDAVPLMTGNTGGYTYLRFKNKENPNNYSIWAGPQTPIITIAASNVTFKNLWLRGGYSGYRWNDTTTVRSNVTIDGGKITASGWMLYVGAADHLMVTNNEHYIDYYGPNTFGAWENRNSGALANCTTEPSRTFCLREFLYSPVFKQWNGTDAHFVQPMSLYGTVTNSTVSGNYFHDTGSGPTVDGNVSDTDISFNTFQNFSATLLPINYANRIYIHDNFFANANGIFRTFGLGVEDEEVYIYNNKIWQPSLAGNFFYDYIRGNNTAKKAKWVLYHNDFVGGNGLIMGSAVTGLGSYPKFNNIHFIDNVWSGPGAMCGDYSGGTRGYNLCSTSDAGGVIAYNWMSNNSNSWKQEGNKIHAGYYIWNSTTLPSFVLPTTGTGSDARGAAYDVSQASFSLQGFSFTALPGASADDSNMGVW